MPTGTRALRSRARRQAPVRPAPLGPVRTPRPALPRPPPAARSPSRAHDASLGRPTRTRCSEFPSVARVARCGASRRRAGTLRAPRPPRVPPTEVVLSVARDLTALVPALPRADAARAAAAPIRPSWSRSRSRRRERPCYRCTALRAWPSRLRRSRGRQLRAELRGRRLGGEGPARPVRDRFPRSASAAARLCAGRDREELRDPALQLAGAERLDLRDVGDLARRAVVEVHAGGQLLLGGGRAAGERLDRGLAMRAQASCRHDRDEPLELAIDGPLDAPHLGDGEPEPPGDDEATLLLRVVDVLTREYEALLLGERRGELQERAALDALGQRGPRGRRRPRRSRRRRRRRVASRRGPSRRALRGLA